MREWEGESVRVWEGESVGVCPSHSPTLPLSHSPTLSLSHSLTLWLILAWWLAGAGVASAVSVAVLPVEDLSKGRNGVNFEITARLTGELGARGFTVLPAEEVMAFMSRNRIRWVGFLDSYHILLARDQLAADLLLLGTINQRQESDKPAMGLSLQLVRTSDATTLWSRTTGLSRDDLQRLLGLGEPDSLDKLLPPLMGRILADWPARFDQPEKERPVVDIESLSLEPKFVQPGQKVRCMVRLRSLGEVKEKPQVFVKAGSRVYMAEESKDGLYEVVWTGSEGKGLEYGALSVSERKLAMADARSRVFESIWTGSEADDLYPVSLSMSWPSGAKKTLFIGYYVVDSHPPEISLDIRGMKLGDTVAFRDEVAIIPRMLDSEPILGYEVSVRDEAGKVLLREEGREQLPSHFTWKGRGGDGNPFPEGIYQISLKVWDRAYNQAVCSQAVAFRPTPPKVGLGAVQGQDGGILLDLEAEGPLPVDYWYVELRYEDGKLAVRENGQQLPAQVTVPTAGQETANGKIGGYVVLRDVLGNQTRKKIDDLGLLAASQAKSHGASGPEVKQDGWLEEF